MSGHNIADEWFRYSENDLIVARHCFEALYPKQTEIAGYHCQQCAEKSLKAFLLFNDVEPPKIHDLRVLCKMCQDVDSSFAELVILCAHLNPYGVAARYPDDISPSEEMTKIAINEAQRIYEFCLGKKLKKM